MNKNVIRKIFEWGIYLFVFLLPWQTRLIISQGHLDGSLWEYGTVSLYGIDILLFVLLILRILVGKQKEGFALFTHKNQKLWSFVIGLLTISFLSIYWAQDSGLALYGFIKLVEGVAIFWIIISSEFKFRNIGIAFGAAAVLQGIIGISQSLFQRTFSSKWLGMALQDASVSGTSVIEDSTGRFLRAYGAFPHPNVLGGFLLIGLVVLFALYLQNKKEKEKYLILAGSVLVAIGLFFSFSRVNWLVLAMVIAFYIGLVFLKKKNNQWHFAMLKFISIILVVFAVFTSIFPNLILTRFSTSTRLEKLSIEQRSNYNQQATELIRGHWLNGVGISNYTLAVYKDIDSNLSGLEYQPVHNVYLLIWSELGLFGLLVFLVLMAQIVILDWKTYTTKSFGSHKWFYIYSAILLMIFTLFLFDHYFWTLSFGIMLFWLILGLWQQALLNPKD